MPSLPLHVTVVDPAFSETGMWGDCSGGWQPAAVEWLGRLRALGVPCTATAQLAGRPPGLVVCPDPAAVDPPTERVLTASPPASGEETLQMLAEALGALVVPDLNGVLVLRLDDPGAAVKEHLRSWAHRPMSTNDWAQVWRTLAGFGRLSAFCCPGYVRADGSVVDSWSESPEEWAGLADGVRRGLADLECHGWTHLVPDLATWTTAPDRHHNPAWYQELWPPTAPAEPSVAAQADRLARWQAGTGVPGTTLVARGVAWGLNTLAAAASRGFRLFNSWGLCFLDTAVPTWSVGVGSPYLDQAAPQWFGDCLPQVGYWHDRDLLVNGPGWFAAQIAAWRDCGARRAWAFADLARAYSPIKAALVDGEVVVGSAPDVPLRVVRAGVS
ncbi:MAG: hypothetical protein ACYCO3_05325 [Mycobacteriales bacterium]